MVNNWLCCGHVHKTLICPISFSSPSSTLYMFCFQSCLQSLSVLPKRPTKRGTVPLGSTKFCSKHGIPAALVEVLIGNHPRWYNRAGSIRYAPRGGVQNNFTPGHRHPEQALGLIYRPSTKFTGVYFTRGVATTFQTRRRATLPDKNSWDISTKRNFFLFVLPFSLSMLLTAV